MTIPPEMIEAVARIIDPMSLGLEGVFDGPVQVGNCIRAREQALAAIRTLAPMMAEVMAKVADKRADDRFAEHGVTEYDTNASYYSGSRAEAYDELDEEDWAISRDIRAKGKEMADG